MFDALKNGRSGDVLAMLRAGDKVSPQVRKLARLLLSEPGGARSPEWSGPVSEGHHEAAEYVLVASAKPEVIARGLHTSKETASHVIPIFHGDHLESIAQRWAERFVKNPKNWDFLPQFDAMFDWVRAGLMEAPATHGAALLLIGARPEPLPDLLKDRDFALARTTLPVIFTTPGVKGASLTQHEESHTDELRTHIIPWLIDEGVWDRDEVLRWTEEALAVDRTAYDKRWFKKLKVDLG